MHIIAYLCIKCNCFFLVLFSHAISRATTGGDTKGRGCDGVETALQPVGVNKRGHLRAAILSAHLLETRVERLDTTASTAKASSNSPVFMP